MGLFSSEPRFCPLCSTELNVNDNDVIGHVATHLDDAVRGQPASGLALSCGCPSAVWPIESNFPTLARDHLVQVHGMRR